MREFDMIKDMVYGELDEISRHGQLTKEGICLIGELVDILKDISTIETQEEGVEVYRDGGGYSQKRMPVYYYNDNGYGGNSYRGGSYSMRNGGSNYRGNGMGGYSRDDGKAHMIDKLEQLMHETTDNNDRMAIQDLINKMGN